MFAMAEKVLSEEQKEERRWKRVLGEGRTEQKSSSPKSAAHSDWSARGKQKKRQQPRWHVEIAQA